MKPLNRRTCPLGGGHLLSSPSRNSSPPFPPRGFSHHQLGIKKVGMAVVFLSSRTTNPFTSCLGLGLFHPMLDTKKHLHISRFNLFK